MTDDVPCFDCGHPVRRSQYGSTWFHEGTNYSACANHLRSAYGNVVVPEHLRHTRAGVAPDFTDDINELDLAIRELQQLHSNA